MATVSFNLVNISSTSSVTFGSLTLAPYGKNGCAKTCTGTPEDFNAAWALYKANGKPIGLPNGGEFTALNAAPYTHATFDGVVNTAGMAAQLSAVLIENDGYSQRTTRVVNTSVGTSVRIGSTTLAPYGKKGCANWVTGIATELNAQWAAHKAKGGRILAVPTQPEFDTMQVTPFTHATYDGVVVMTNEMLKT